MILCALVLRCTDKNLSKMVICAESGSLQYQRYLRKYCQTNKNVLYKSQITITKYIINC